MAAVVRVGYLPQGFHQPDRRYGKGAEDRKWPNQPASVKPAWPFARGSDGSGVRIDANADVHFRAHLSDQGIVMHILSQGVEEWRQAHLRLQRPIGVKRKFVDRKN